MKTIFLSLVFFFVVQLTVEAQSLNDSLLLYYSFSGNADDFSINNQHGQNFGATLSMDRFGNLNSAYSFDGIDDYIQLPDTSFLRPDLPMTISFWIKANAPLNNLKLYFLSTDYQINDYSGIFIHANSSNPGQIGVSYGADLSNTGYQYRRTKVSNSVIAPLIWQHIVCVVSGPTDMEIYINGINAGGSYSGVLNQPIAYSGSPGRIGMNGGTPGTGVLNYQGLMDDVMIWKRALNSSEIGKLYSGCVNVAMDPTDQILTSGSIASFNTIAFDSSSTYQWQVFDGTGYINLIDTGQYSGSFSDSLTITGITYLNHAQQYRCLVTSPLCSDTSDIAYLFVTPNPTVDHSLHYDGINDYVDIGNSVANGVRTITFKFKLDVPHMTNTPTHRGIMSRSDPTNNGEFNLTLAANGTPGNLSGKLAFYRYLNGTYHRLGSNSSNWNTNTWYSVAAVIHPLDGMHLFVDGIKQSETDASTDPIMNRGETTIIGGFTDAIRYFPGKIDQVSLWDIALDSSQINQYILCPPDGSESGLKALYHFDEGFGTITADHSLNGFNGFLINGPLWSTDVPPDSCCPPNIIGTNPNSLYVTAGSDAIFSVSSPYSNASYQWQIMMSSNFIDLSNAGQFSGVNNDTLKISNVTTSNSGQQYRCIVDVAACQEVSSTAILTSCPIIMMQPISQTTIIGDPTQFLVQYNSLSAQYQWQTNIGFGFNDIQNAGQYSGVNNDTLIVSNTAMINNNQLFRCIMTDGSCTDTTSVVSITLVDDTGLSDGDERNKFALFPNPTDQYVYVVTSSQMIGRNIHIYDVAGKLIFATTLESEKTRIDVSMLQSGVYYMGFESESFVKLVIASQ